MTAPKRRSLLFRFRRGFSAALPAARLLGLFLFTSTASQAGTPVKIATAARALAVGCDYYIITDSVFTLPAQRLATLRHKLTPDVAQQPCIADMGDIYRDYPPRGARWTSLQDFLKAVHTAFNARLSHVVLLGDASFEDASPGNHVPTFTERIGSLDRYSADTVFYDTFSTDDAYSAFFDSLNFQEPPHLAFAIGRIPARTRQQADAYIDKVEAYESHYAYGPRAFTYGFLSDDDLQKGSPDGQEPILPMPELHQQIWDSLLIKPFVRRTLSIEFPIKPDGSKPAAKDSTLGLFNAGPGRVYFIGHGSPHQLTDEKILEVPGDLQRLHAKALQPIVSMLACTTARFADPDSESMGEQFLFHPNGAIAFLGGTIPTFAYPNNALFMHWNTLAMQGGTLGRSFAAAKDSANDARNNAAYVILGDPALTLRVPAFDILPALVSGPGRFVLENSGPAGDSVYLQLVRIDSLPYDAVISGHNIYQTGKLYPRESVLAERRGALSASGGITLLLPSAGDPKALAVKVMIWNSHGMRYGHFPVEALGDVALRPVAAVAPERQGYRLVLRGAGLVLERNGRRLGLDGRALR